MAGVKHDPPIRIGEFVSLGTDCEIFYWWDDTTDTFYEDYPGMGDYRRVEVQMGRLPDHCQRTLLDAKDIIEKGWEIPAYERKP